MIRHITSDINFERIKNDKQIKNPNLYKTRPSGESGAISFEKYNGNDNLVYLVGKSKIKNDDKINKIVVIYIDENNLNSDDIIFTSSEKGMRDKECYTKKECVLYFNMDCENKDYKAIGEYVHVKGPISIDKIDHIEFFDKNELDDILDIKI